MNIRKIIFVFFILIYLLDFNNLFAQIDTFCIKGTVISLNTGKIDNEVQIIRECEYNSAVICKCDVDSLGRFFLYGIPKGKIKLSCWGFHHPWIDTTFVIESNIVDFNFLIYVDCYKDNSVNREVALRDIKIGKPRLLYYGGIIVIEYENQNRFSKKYGINYNYYGEGGKFDYCDCVREYNIEVFKYLDRKFGKTWRKEVRTDLYGLEGFKY